MIIVTGATGKLGREIVARLVERVSPGEVGVSVRDPAKAGDLSALGVRVRRGDFADPASLPNAFEGARQVLIVSSNARATGGDTIAQHRAAIDAARAAGAGRIVYTSHKGASATSAFPPMLDHAATEDLLVASGVAWTALRNGFYAASALQFMGDIATSRAIYAPADGKVAWTAHADLAETAAIVLAEPDRFDGPTPPLTGAEALDMTDLAALAGEALGVPVARPPISDERFEAMMAERGAPAAAARIALGFYRASRAGEFGGVDPTLERLLGRPPIAMRAVIEEALGKRGSKNP